jgi:hypothetical protein
MATESRMMNRRNPGIRPPLDHHLHAWLGVDQDRILTLREVWQSAAAMLGGSSLLWLGHTVVRFFFS